MNQWIYTYVVFLRTGELHHSLPPVSCVDIVWVICTDCCHQQLWHIKMSFLYSCDKFWSEHSRDGFASLLESAASTGMCWWNEKGVGRGAWSAYWVPGMEGCDHQDCWLQCFHRRLDFLRALSRRTYTLEHHVCIPVNKAETESAFITNLHISVISDVLH